MGVRVGGCEDAHHSLGHGKPLGAGAVKVSVEQCKANSASDEPAEDCQTYIAKFKAMMEEYYPGKLWEESPQLQHLLAFANLAENEGKLLSYMQLKDQNDSLMTYTKAKKKEMISSFYRTGSIKGHLCRAMSCFRTVM